MHEMSVVKCLGEDSDSMEKIMSEMKKRYIGKHTSADKNLIRCEGSSRWRVSG
jgi:hypothetical protein